MKRLDRILGVIYSIIIFLLFGYIYYHGKGTIDHIIFLPFFVIAIGILGLSISRLFYNQKLDILFKRMVLLTFFTWIVVFLAVWDYQCIQAGEPWMVLLSLPFIGVAIFGFVQLYKDAKEKTIRK